MTAIPTRATPNASAFLIMLDSSAGGALVPAFSLVYSAAKALSAIIIASPTLYALANMTDTFAFVWSVCMRIYLKDNNLFK